MSILDKLKKKSDKSTQSQRPNKTADKKPAADLTVEQIKSQATSGKVKKSGSTVKQSSKKVQKEDTKQAYRTLIKPMVTEKGTYLVSENKYLFEVAKGTNKIEIKKAIEAVYGVSPKSVNIINLPGKKVRYGRVHGKTKDRKKAVVTLRKGDSIQVYEGV